MEFTYRIQEEEMAEYANVVRPLRKLKLIVMAMALVIAALCFVLAAILATTLLTQVTFVILGLAFLIVSYLYGYLASWVGRRLFRQNPELAAERRVQFVEDGIISDTEFHHLQLKWGSFNGFKETKKIFLLLQGQNQGSIFPKRIFSPQELEEFRLLLARKIPVR